MIGFKLFRHSLRQIFGNMDDVIRLTALPWTAICLTGYLLGLQEALMRYFIVLQSFGEAQFPAAQVLIYLGVSMVCGMWIAVAWHRFVLLGERVEGFLPAWHGARMMDYAGMVVVTTLLATLIGLGVGIGGGILLGIGKAIAPDLAMGVGVVIGLAALLLLLSWASRLSACLPGVAIGHHAGPMQSWRATRGHNLEIILAMVLTIIVLSLLRIPFSWAAPLSTVSYLGEAITGWAMTILVLSLMTTFYGYYVEGRPLVGGLSSADRRD